MRFTLDSAGFTFAPLEPDLFYFRARGLHDRRPALEVRLDHLLHVLGAAADDVVAEVGDTLAELGVLRRLHRGGVEPVDHRTRRSYGRGEAEPDVRHVARHAGLGDGRQVGQRRVALRAGRRERAQLARL